ncbi:MAG: glycosyltransferase family 4 protein [Nitrospirae bacterium]|nr:glycosyltransferase family 4 protein [Nitrospirota bacterium]
MKIAYVTVQLPYGPQESFIIPEIREVQRQGNDVIVLPLRPGEKIFHAEAEFLRKVSDDTRLFSVGVLREFVTELFLHPLKAARVVANIVRKSKNVRILLKNLIVVPRGFYFARLVKRCRIDHIHAHWASTPSTAAYIASFLSGIPWSFTAHRWDIAENNMLDEKVRTASFGRTIDAPGRREIIDATGADARDGNVITIHMGVGIPGQLPLPSIAKDSFSFLCPANFVAKKGHSYLIKAVRIAVDKGLDIHGDFAGDGPLEDGLKKLVESLQLDGRIRFLGRLGHDKLLEMYGGGAVDAVILPSIVTSDGEKEGIPVALMEAMAYGIPVISTDTGGIPELLNGAGAVIPQKDSAALADAIERMAKDGSYRDTLRKLGRDRVLRDFNLCTNVEMLIGRMREN